MNNTSVHQVFDVAGDYDLGSSLQANSFAGTIVVTVYQSDGTTPLSNTTVIPSVINLPSGVQQGPWSVRVTHSGTYTGAVIAAVLTPTGGSGQSASVSGIDIM
jgi:hypothetical protein